MKDDEIHQYDIGTRFLITVKENDEPIDVTYSTNRQLFFKKPSDTVISKTALVFNDGSASSGIMYYDTVANDLDEVGIWKLQGRLELASGTYSTNIYTFKVHCNL
jgi:hypothetical protein